MASYASLGDVILAEPGALIGFAGPRVIQDTIGEELPPGFQRAEFVLDTGFVDAVVHRKEMRDTSPGCSASSGSPPTASSRPRRTRLYRP